MEIKVIIIFPFSWWSLNLIEDFGLFELDDNDDDFREEDEEYSDDDDMSWKVRRAAAKCLDAVIGTRHEMLMEFYRNVSPALIARFKGQGNSNLLQRSSEFKYNVEHCRHYKNLWKLM